MSDGKHMRHAASGQDRSRLSGLPQVDAGTRPATPRADATRTQSRAAEAPVERQRAAEARRVRKLGKRRAGSRVSALSNILLGMGIALLAIAGFLWARAQWNYHEQDEVNDRLAAYAVISEDGETPPEVDWEALRAVNADVVGWIQIPGTVINYPVYQSNDNDYYLDTNAEGVHGVGGQIFLDYLNQAPGMLDSQTIIYGHHLKNGAMFKQVADMENQGFFDSIHTVWYVTDGAAYKLQPLFLYYTDPDDTNVRVFNFQSDEELRGYLLGLLQEKGVTRCDDAEAIIGGTTRVLTLATCNYIEGEGRTILVCVEQTEAQAARGSAG